MRRKTKEELMEEEINSDLKRIFSKWSKKK